MCTLTPLPQVWCCCVCTGWVYCGGIRQFQEGRQEECCWTGPVQTDGQWWGNMATKTCKPVLSTVEVAFRPSILGIYNIHMWLKLTDLKFILPVTTWKNFKCQLHVDSYFDFIECVFHYTCSVLKNKTWFYSYTITWRLSCLNFISEMARKHIDNITPCPLSLFFIDWSFENSHVFRHRTDF